MLPLQLKVLEVSASLRLDCVVAHICTGTRTLGSIDDITQLDKLVVVDDQAVGVLQGKQDMLVGVSSSEFTFCLAWNMFECASASLCHLEAQFCWWTC